MNNSQKPADLYEAILLILHDAPPKGLSHHDIQQKASERGFNWSFRTIETLIHSLGDRIAREKVWETATGKITKYRLRDRR